MTQILIPVVLVAAIGLIAGLGLAVASIVFAVPKDEKAEAVREVLPGANCGACGFSGCDGYAAALSKGETTECNRCTPGGNDVAKQVAAIMGMEAGAHGVEHGLGKAVAVVDVQNHHAEHGAVGRDQRQIDAQRAV